MNTSLWNLNASATIADISALQGAAAEVALDIESGARFLQALNLRKIDTGPFHFSGAVKHNGSHSQIDIGLGAGSSRVEANLKVADTDGIAYARGRVFSEELELTDLSKAVMAATEIQDLFRSQEDENAAKDSPDAYQPLVVEETYQPLVLEKDYEALVLPPEYKGLADFITLRKLLLETDLDRGYRRQETNWAAGYLSHCKRANRSKRESTSWAARGQIRRRFHSAGHQDGSFEHA